MKEDIHPKWYPDAKVILNGEVIMTVGATKPEVSVEIWSGTHPFYTGQQRLLDTEGQVDRFMSRLKKREEILQAKEVDEERQSPLNLTIDNIGVAKRAENAMREAGLTTVGDVLEQLEAGDDHLLAIPGVGQKALIDVKRFMRGEGLIE